MRSLEHFAVGLATSLSGAAALSAVESYPLPTLAALVAGGVVLSVFVDLDHFLIDRYLQGDWRSLWACLRDPVWAFTEQEEIFDESETLEPARLASHAVIGAVLVAGLATVAVPVAAFVAAVLTAHVVCDVLRDRELA